MKIESIEFFCDVCGKKIINEKDDVHQIPDSLKYTFGCRQEIIYEHICPVCSKKILDYITDLIPKNDSKDWK